MDALFRETDARTRQEESVRRERVAAEQREVIERFKATGETGAHSTFQQGGKVPGPLGAPLHAIVHGGETVVPAGRSMGNVVVNVTINGDVNGIDDFWRKVDRHIRDMILGGGYHGVLTRAT